MASEIRLGSREVATWLVASAALLGLAVVGEPLLVPLVFALLLWAGRQCRGRRADRHRRSARPWLLRSR